MPLPLPLPLPLPRVPAAATALAFYLSYTAINSKRSLQTWLIGRGGGAGGGVCGGEEGWLEAAPGWLVVSLFGATGRIN